MPNPNTYSGPSRLCRTGDQEWTTVTDLPTAGLRGIDILEFARALHSGWPPRNSPENALHVLEIMTAAATSAETSAFVDVHSGFTSMPLLPQDCAPESRTLA